MGTALRYRSGELMQRRVPYGQMLRSLGVEPPDTMVLPCRTSCPRCRGTMTIYEDARETCWLHCQGCGLAGDTLSIPMELWGCDALTAIERLLLTGAALDRGAGDARAAGRYETRQLGARRKFTEYLQQVTSRHGQEPAPIRKIQDALGLNRRHDPERWLTQLGPHVGWSGEAEMRSILGRFGRGKGERTFAGGGWQHFVVLPCGDLPGRLSGLWAVGRGGEWPKDWQFVAALPMTSGDVTSDPGLLFYDASRADTEAFENTSFVVWPPPLALALQGRHYRDHGAPLPLGATYELGRFLPRKVFANVPGRDWVFWSSAPTPQVMGQVRAASGRLSTEPRAAEDDRNPSAWLRRLRKKALPWRAYLARLADRADVDTLENALAGLGCGGDAAAWDDVVLDCNRRQRRKILGLARRSFSAPEVKFGVRNTIVEQDDRWVIRESGVCVADFTARIAAVEPGDKEATLRLRVRVRYRRRRFEFACGNRTSSHGFVCTLQEACHRAGLPLPTIAPGWRARVLDLTFRYSKLDGLQADPTTYNRKA